MPYPTEHAARIKNPDQFKKIRRQNNKFGPGIHVIWGITKDDKAVIQAIRFDKTKFTESEAKKWLKDNKLNYLIFEEATSNSLKLEDRWFKSDISNEIQNKIDKRINHGK
jgi:hypothetical protein